MRSRKAVGSLIGIGFLLMIISVGFSFYQVMNRIQNSSNDIIASASILDRYASDESLEIIRVRRDTVNSLNLTVKNNGQVLSKILWLGVFDETQNTKNYYSVNTSLNPYETQTNIGNNSITINPSNSYTIQLLTRLGNIYHSEYPEENSQNSQTILYIFEVGPPFYPNNHQLLGNTTIINGGVDDLDLDDGSYMQLGSYLSLEKGIFYPDNNISNVDGNSSIGNHNIFSDMQQGPDSVFDTLSEEETSNPGATHYVKPSSFQDIDNKWDNEPNAYDINNLTSATNSKDRVIDNIYWQLFNNTDKGRICKVDLHLRIDVNFVTVLGESDSITIQWWVGSTQGNSTYTIDDGNDGSDLHIRFLDVSEPNDGLWSWNDINNIEIRQVGIYVGPGDDVIISTDEVWGMVTTYAQEVDLEVQFTNVDYNLDNEELCVYTNSSGDENLRVDIWYNSVWNNIFSALGSGWNNASITAYLDSPTLTIRFNDAEVLGDSVQSSWDIDVALLSLWDNGSKQVTLVEYTGQCNVTDFSRLTLTSDLNYNSSSVDMTIQLYNFEAQAYSAIGEGYLSYTTSSTPGTDEKYSEIVYTNPGRFVNSTGYWKVKISGSKTTINKTQCNIDLVEFEPLYMLPGETVEYNDWTEYGYKVTGLNSDPIKFGYFSIYHNATNVDLRDSDTLQAISNPDLLLLDVNGEYYFDLRSSNLNEETFSLGCTIGDQNIEKIITQTAP